MARALTACAAVGLLLLVAAGCGRATGAGGPAETTLDPVSAATAAAVPTVTAAESAVAGTPPVEAPDDVVAPAGPGVEGRADPVVSPPSAAGPDVAVRATTRTLTTPTPAVKRPPSVREPVRSPAAATTTTTVRGPGPTRTPAPVRIDPITAYGGSLDGFTNEVGRGCSDKFGRTDCLRIAPSTRQDGVEVTGTCRVVGSDPDLRDGLAIDPDAIPLVVSVEVTCEESL